VFRCESLLFNNFRGVISTRNFDPTPRRDQLKDLGVDVTIILKWVEGYVLEDRDQWLTPVSTVMNLWDPSTTEVAE
jgi:hypothetical protein